MSRHTMWGIWAAIIGAAFAIVAVTQTNAILYIVVAIIAGAGYTIITRLTCKRPEAAEQMPPDPRA